MKKPNGYGTVYKKSGKRRNPWVAEVTKEFYLELNGKRVDPKNIDEEDLPNCKYKRKRAAIGYFPTRKDAEVALAKYNSNPYDTGWLFKDVYAKWTEHGFDGMADGTILDYKRAYKYLFPLHNRKFADLKVIDLEKCLKESGRSLNVQITMKKLLSHLYKYGLRYDMCNYNMAERFSVDVPETEIERKPFTAEEIQWLWDNKDDYRARSALIMIYTGMRINELYKMELDKDNWCFVGGSKTKAGKNRIVPIREKIKPLVGIEIPFAYGTFYNTERKWMKELGHTPHDCRVTFTTMYKDADEIAVKLIIGHKINDLTKRVYTKYTLDELRNVIESIDY